jgi:cyclopropane-fatty-acyl-phospholipid synthase
MYRGGIFPDHLIKPFMLQGGQLEVWQDDGPLFVLGDGNGPSFIVNVDGSYIFQDILRDPDFQLGQTYVEGRWSLVHGDLGKFLSWIVKNNTGWVRKAPEVKPLAVPSEKGIVQRPYDLGDDLYRSFLDEGMNYSCAFFDDHRMSLRDAQLNKIYKTLERSHILPGMKVLDIGCGYGQLCHILARSLPSAEVTGIALSQNQIEWAKNKSSALNGNKPEFLVSDYRAHALDHPETYDRIISVGMFEHIGQKSYDQFFNAVRRMLKTGGHALVHSTMRAEAGTASSRWLDTYIFPGSHIPYMPEALQAADRAGLKILREPFIHAGTNYAETLRRWRQNFYANEDRLDAKKYDARFRRIWEFYLALCEASFDGYGNYVAQMIFEKK